MKRNNDTFIEHGSGPALAAPWKLLLDICSGFRRGGDLASALLLRNIRAQYRQTILGYGWIVIPQLATVGAIILLARAGIFKTGIQVANYDVYVLVGTVLWQAFFDGFSSPLKVVRSSMAMLGSVKFPREALVLAGMGEVLWSFGVRLLVTLGLLVILGWSPSWSLLLCPLGILALVILGWIFGILLVPVGILFKDVEYAMPIIGLLWFLVTPVAYAMPESPMWFVRWNPVVPVLELNRILILGGEGGQVMQLLSVVALACPLALLGVVLFRVALPHLIKRLPD
jgi:lipopolysaccharide transport system permease protein